MRKRDSDNMSQSGNVMIYVIIAIALIGLLTVTLTNQGEQADTQDINDEIAELYALELIEYAATAKSVIEQMEITGTNFDDFDFVTPDSTPFATAPHIHKVYHPQGGGLTYRDSTSFPDEIWASGSSERGWHYMTNTNVEWTPSTAHDIMFTFMDLNLTICENINEKITGNTSIPTIVGATANELFREVASAPEVDFTLTECAACDGYPSLCVGFGGDAFHFYNLLLIR